MSDLEQLFADLKTRALEAEQAKTDKDEAYRQRNVLVHALASIFPSGIAKTDIQGWNPEWHWCCFIDLPTGQVSYHFHESQYPLFKDLPEYRGEWDGHDKEVVERRLSMLRAPSVKLTDVTLRAIDPEKPDELFPNRWLSRKFDALSERIEKYIDKTITEDEGQRVQLKLDDWLSLWTELRNLEKITIILAARTEELGRRPPFSSLEAVSNEQFRLLKNELAATLESLRSE